MATPTVVHLPEVLLGGFLLGLSTSVHMFTYQRAEDPQRGLMSIIMGAKKVNGHTAKFILSLFCSGIVLGLIVLPELFQPQAINLYQNSCYDLIRSGLSFGVGAAWSGGCFQRNSYHIPSYLRFVRVSGYSTQNIIAMVVFVTSAALSDLYRKTYHEKEHGITKTPLNLASFKMLNAPSVSTYVAFCFAIAFSIIPFSWKAVQQKKNIQTHRIKLVWFYMGGGCCNQWLDTTRCDTKLFAILAVHNVGSNVGFDHIFRYGFISLFTILLSNKNCNDYTRSNKYI